MSSSFPFGNLVEMQSISIESENYPVPCEYIKQKVNVRLTRRLVEVFFEGNRIAGHPRPAGRPGQYSTHEKHMPKEHQEYVSWNAERFLKRADKIGAHTKTVKAFKPSSSPGRISSPGMSMFPNRFLLPVTASPGAGSIISGRRKTNAYRKYRNKGT
jgi:hypothetical protein